jgi:signal transduction histidine kinase
MRRLLLVSLLVGAVVVVAMALLVQRALQSVEIERAARHRAVADRVLDEMERELTAWLVREEERPYEQYRFFVVPQEPGLRLARSPLSEPAADPFVLGYFQVEPNGSVTSPRWPGNEPLAAEAGWRAEPAVQERVAAVGQVVETWLAAHRGGRERLEAPLFPPPPPPPAAGPSKIAAAELRYLESLNRAAEERGRRASKVERTQAPSALNFEQDTDNVLQQAVESQLSRQEDGGASPTLPPSLDDELAAQVAAQVQQQLPAAGRPVDVVLEPMVGRALGDGRLLLYRTVVVGERVYRQGMLLDVAALAGWLAQRVIGEGVLAGRASLAVDPAPAAPAGGFAYAHRFAEPFGGFPAALLLAPLPELAGDRYVAALSALLAVATFLGLLALFRMAAVALRFAERRSNFVSAVTHELKTPLTAIRMYAEMLRDGMIPSEGKRQECYAILTAESERLSRLLDNVLELGRLERGQRPMTVQQGPLETAVEEVLQLLRPQAESRGFTLRSPVARDLPLARFERDALSQVLHNLVDNALKYARDAEPKEVVVELAPAAGSGVALVVRDHGPGVAPGHLRHVFEPFYRGEAELTRTTTGAGIGLALVRQLVERMGGRVTGRNHPDGGFEVTVTLPGG